MVNLQALIIRLMSPKKDKDDERKEAEILEAARRNEAASRRLNRSLETITPLSDMNKLLRGDDQ